MIRRARMAGNALVVALAFTVALTLPAASRADEPTPPRPSRLARNLVIAGEVVFAAGYVTSVGTSFAIGLSCGVEAGEPLCQRSRFLWGALPLAGPFVQVGYDHDFASSVALFTVPTVVQLAGVALVVAGVVVRTRKKRRAR